MNERLAELQKLWDKNFSSELSPAENARLSELMSDDTLMEAFSAAQAERSGLEPDSGMNEAEWKRVDSRVMATFARSRFSYWLKPLAIAFAASLAVAGSWSIFGSGSKERPDLGRSARSFNVESAAEPRAEAKEEAKSDGLHEIKAGKMSVLVEQKLSGQAAVRILDSSGRQVKSLFNGFLAEGKTRFEWNGLDSGGAKVKPGSYRIDIQTASGHETRKFEIRAKK